MKVKFIQNLQQIDHQIWLRFVKEHPQGNIFQTPHMFQVYLGTKGYEPFLVSLEDDSGNLCGVLLALIQDFMGRVAGAFASRALILGGPLVRDNELAFLKKLLYEYSDAIKGRAVYSEVRNSFRTTGHHQILLEEGYQYEDHLNILVDLGKKKEALWSGLHKTRRKQIKRGQLRGAEASEIIANKDRCDIIKCYEILTEVYKRARLPLPKIDYFRSALEHLASEGILKIFAVKYKSEIIGCRWVLCFRDIIYDWWAGSLQNHYDKYPNDILPWEVIKWGSENNYKIFDFGGAGKPGVPYGVRDYKIKFGGEIVNFGRYQKIHQPVKMRLAKTGFKAWQLLKSI